MNRAKCMSEETVKKIQELIDAGKGDSDRLHNILNSLQNGKPLESSDQQYIDGLSLTEPEAKYDSITFENTSESIDEQNFDTKPETNEISPKNESMSNRKKTVLAGIVIAAIVLGYIGANAYAVSTLEFRPHQGTQYTISS